MNKPKYARLIKTTLLIFGIFLLLSRLLTWFTWGFPWELIKMRSVVQQYLELKYGKEMMVTGGYRFLRDKRYIFTAYPITDPNLYFQIFIYADDYTNVEDSYNSTMYRYLLTEQIKEEIVSRFGKDATVKVQIENPSKHEIDQNGQDLQYCDFLEKYAQHYSIDIGCGENIIKTNEFLEQASDIILYIFGLNMEPNSISFSFYTGQGEKEQIILAHDEIISAILSQNILTLLKDKLV